jgi:hypothetical protein
MHNDLYAFVPTCISYLAESYSNIAFFHAEIYAEKETVTNFDTSSLLQSALQPLVGFGLL